MMYDLKNKTAVITGGCSGIGLAMCTALAKAGAEVYALDFSPFKNEASPLPNMYHIKCDVTHKEAVNVAFNNLTQCDILINNAGIAHIGNAENTSEEDFDRIMSINVKGYYNCIQAALPMLKKKGGVILNIASVAAYIGLKDRFVYSISKGAIIAMTVSVAKDYIDFGIRCNSISPARVHTPFVDGFIAKNYPGKEEEMYEKLAKSQPIGRMARPEEVAAFALYLVSDEAAFLTGMDYPIDGGFVRLNN